MKRVIALAIAAFMLVGALAPAAMADNDKWDAEKEFQVLVNRCSNAGAGNGGELGVFFDGKKHDFALACVEKYFGHSLIDETFEWGPFYIWFLGGSLYLTDLDPGNSMGNNNAPGAPPGQVS